MGCLFGSRLAPYAQVKMLGTWRAGVDAIASQGISVESVQGGVTQDEDRMQVFATIDPSAIGECDLVIVARKSWQTEQAALHAAKILAPEGIVVTLQNGLGNIEKIASVVGADRAALAVTTQGATLVGPGHVRHVGGGPTHIGATPATRRRLESVTELFKRAGFETYLAEDVESLLWGKLVANCGINALTAILRVPNGELLARHDAEVLMMRAAEECAAVARAKGVTADFADGRERVREVARLTAANRSSMLQDLLRDAPTEIDAINGAVAFEGARLGVPTPTNEMLWRLVRALVNHTPLPQQSTQALKEFARG
jgi:2-dehydropantoate 2-reductase